MGLNWRLWFVALLLFIIAALALHYSSFSAPMYYDSLIQLQTKEHIYASGDLLKVIQIFPQRPAAMISFYVNYLIWGMNPYYFRVVNAVLLALTAFMAALTIMLIFVASGSANAVDSREKQAVALVLGFVFLVHPVQTYFVAYIWQRMGLLACLFFFSAFTAYLGARTGLIKRAVWGYAACAMLFILALSSKENAATLPVVLILAETAFFREGRKSLLKRSGVIAAIAIVVVAALSLLERPHGLGESSGILTTVAKYYGEAGLAVSQVVISQCRVLFSYLFMLLIPAASNVPLTAAQVIYDSPFESPVIAAAVVGTLAILSIGIYLLRKRPLTGFGLLFFLLNLMPEAFLVPQYLFFAYRATLPMFGLLLVLADGLLFVLAKTGSVSSRKWHLGPLAAGLAAAIVIMSALTVSKAQLWRDPVAFWTDIVEALPPYKDKVEKKITLHALISLSAALHAENRSSEAIAIIQRTLEVDPNNSMAYGQLGEAYRTLGDLKKGESYLKKAVELDPDAVAFRTVLAEFYLAQDNLPEAWLHMQRAAALAPSDPRCLTGLGRILVRQGKDTEAISYFRQAIKVAPGSGEARYHLGETYVNMGMDRDAEHQFRQALQLKRQYWQAHNSLGLLLAKSGNVTSATAHFREALALNPGNWRVHNNLGALLAKSGNFQQAAVHFQEAVRINPDDMSARKNLERIRRMTGTSR